MRLNVKGLEHLSKISSKYRFRDIFEIEQEEVIDFCRDFLDAQQLGLRVDEEDAMWIEKVLMFYTEGQQ